MTRFRWGVVSDVGRVRSINQDSALAVEGFFAVADGMGGHRGGEVASAIVIEALRDELPLLSADDLLDAIQRSNLAVLTRADDDPALRGMGTTLCVLALVESEDDQPLLAIANVGDSRVYQFASGVFEQMTEDHSMVAEMLRAGRITAAEAESHPQRNVLTRALGIDAGVHIDAWSVRAVPGDRWLLCSDGLFNEVPEPTIAAVLAHTVDPAGAASQLVRLANESGGRDNITVLVVDVVADDDAHAAIARPDGEAGDLAGARRPVAEAPAAPTSNGRAGDTGGPAIDAVAGDAAERRGVGTGAAHGSARPLAARVRESWRVVAFAVALLALVVVVLVAWVAFGGDDTVEPDPPPPTSTSVPSTTSVVTSTTTALSPTSVTTTSIG